VNTKGSQGFTALMLAAGPGASEMNQPQGAPPLKADTEIFQLLLAKGADVNAKNEFGETALTRANVSEKVKMLLARSPDVNAKDEYGKTALLKAADLGNVDAVDALLKSGADPNAKDVNGTTPLLQALHFDHGNKSGKNYIETARLLLLAKNIDVNAQNQYGETALMRAVSLGNAEIVKLLLGRGADVSLSDEAGTTAEVVAYGRGNAEIQNLLGSVAGHAQTPKVLNAFLRAAIEKKDAGRVKDLLAKGADPNYRFSLGYGLEGTTNIVLVLATMVGDTRIVQMLLDKGADLNAKGFIRGDESGIEKGTALEAAEHSNQPDLVSLLRKASGTSPVVDYVSRGNGRQAKGDLDGAIADFNKAIEINPRDARAYNSLAWLLATSSKEGLRDGKRAVENARKASELTNWENPYILDTLAAAYAEVANFEEAAKWENKALSFTEFAKSLGEEARQRLQLYMQRKPYREKQRIYCTTIGK
jgi:ankyrin repeat protein